jgi:hypothetical protein
LTRSSSIRAAVSGQHGASGKKRGTSGMRSLRGKVWNLRESPDRGASGEKRGASTPAAEKLCLGSPSARFKSLDRGASGEKHGVSAPAVENLCLGSPSAHFKIRLLLGFSSVSRIFF